MNNLFEEPMPDGLLYHYTSQTGLLGIIQNREIWATNLLFLNDSMEFNYAIEFFGNYVEKIKKKSELPQNEFQFLEEFCKQLEEFATPHNQSFDGIYVCSFSRCEDLLSQWRGYCPDGSGYSLGFDFTDFLRIHAADKGFRLVRCVYAEDKQIELVENFTLKILNYFRESEVNFLNNNKLVKKHEMANKVWNDFLFIAPKLKHPKFIEEEDWRLISNPRPLDNVEFRESKSMIVPYIKVELIEKTRLNLDCIHKIYFGPTLHPNLTRISLDNLIIKEKVYRYVFHSEFGRGLETKCEILKSKIPYRVK